MNVMLCNNMYMHRERSFVQQKIFEVDMIVDDYKFISCTICIV